MPFKDPQKRRQYQKERARLRRAGDPSSPRETRLPIGFRVATAADVLAMLDDELAAVRDARELGVVERARLVGFLGTVCLKAIEVSNLTGRLEALEAALRQRSPRTRTGG